MNGTMLSAAKIRNMSGPNGPTRLERPDSSEFRQQMWNAVHRFCAANLAHNTPSVTEPAKKAVKRSGT
jgi:hypothetical protein